MTTRVDAVHFDVPLSNFAIKLPVDQGMIADLVAPVIPVRKESDKYYIFNREELKLDVNPLRADTAVSEEFTFDWSESNYACKEYAKHVAVSQREMDNADSPIEPKMAAVEGVVFNIRLWREKRVADLIQSNSNWGGYTTPSTKWNASGADIESDVNAAKQAMFLKGGLFPNVAVINDKVADAIIAWLRSSGTITGITLEAYRQLDAAGSMSGEDRRLSGLFGIQRWIVAKALYDTAARGVTESLARLWGDHCQLLYVNPGRPAMKSISAMYTFQARGFAVKSWHEAPRASDIVEPSHIVDEKITSSLCGYRLHTVLA